VHRSRWHHNILTFMRDHPATEEGRRAVLTEICPVNIDVAPATGTAASSRPNGVRSLPRFVQYYGG